MTRNQAHTVSLSACNGSENILSHTGDVVDLDLISDFTLRVLDDAVDQTKDVSQSAQDLKLTA